MGIRGSVVTLCTLLAGLAPASIGTNSNPARDIRGSVNFGSIQIIPHQRYNERIPLQEIVDNYMREHRAGNFERKIIVRKSERTLGVYINDTRLKEYRVILGFDPINDKEVVGDARTPEGDFYVAAKVPNVTFHNGLLINYPNREDAERGLRNNLITQQEYHSIITAVNSCQIPPQNTALGSGIEIHGKNSPWWSDRTLGCIATENEGMDELYLFAQAGCSGGRPRTRIIIKP